MTEILEHVLTVTGLFSPLPLRLRRCTSCVPADRAPGPLDPRWRLTLPCKRNRPLPSVDFLRCLRLPTPWHDLDHNQPTGAQSSTFARQRIRELDNKRTHLQHNTRRAHEICVPAPEFAIEDTHFFLPLSETCNVCWPRSAATRNEPFLPYNFPTIFPYHFLNHLCGPRQATSLRGHVSRYGSANVPAYVGISLRYTAEPNDGGVRKG